MEKYKNFFKDLNNETYHNKHKYINKMSIKWLSLIKNEIENQQPKRHDLVSLNQIIINTSYNLEYNLTINDIMKNIRDNIEDAKIKWDFRTMNYCEYGNIPGFLGYYPRPKCKEVDELVVNISWGFSSGKDEKL